MILFNQISLTFDGNEKIIQDLSFNIARDEFVFIYHHDPEILFLLSELISGEKKPDSGLIRLMNKYDPRPVILKNEISIVYKENIFLKDRDLGENFQFITQVKDLTKTSANLRTRRTFNLVDMGDCKHKRIDELLPHQLIRANIAQALLTYPSIIILEDPTSGLDEVNSQAILHLTEEINKLGVTVVFLSSDRGLVKRNNRKKIIFLNSGSGSDKGEGKEGSYA